MGFAAAILAIIEGYLSYHGYGLGSLLSALNMVSLGDGTAIIDRYIPMALILQLGLARALTPYLIAPLHLAASSVIKFTKA